jgi:hypothetical protein
MTELRARDVSARTIAEGRPGAGVGIGKEVMSMQNLTQRRLLISLAVAIAIAAVLLLVLYSGGGGGGGGGGY